MVIPNTVYRQDTYCSETEKKDKKTAKKVLAYTRI